MRTRGRRGVRPGDVFAVPLGDGRFALGQVFARQDPILYLGAFSGAATELGSVKPDEVVGRELVLGGNFLDSPFSRGDWPILGNAPVRGGIPFPCYKVRVEGKDYLETWDGRRHREATPEELEWLENRTDRSPAILSNALKALHGLADWAPRYERLRAEFLARSAALAPQGEHP